MGWLANFRKPAVETRVVSIALITVAIAAVVVLIWLLAPWFDVHEGTAAWVQAAGSLLIIAATAWIAGQSSREMRERDRLTTQRLHESVASLARNCLGALDSFLKAPTSLNDPRGSFLRAYTPSDFDITLDGLAQVPLRDLGNADLIAQVLTLRGAMSRIKKYLDTVQNDSLVHFDADSVQNQRVSVFNAVAGILRIIDGSAAEQEISRLA